MSIATRPSNRPSPVGSAALHVHVVVTSRPNPEPLQQVTLDHPLRQAGVLRLHTFSETEIELLLQAKAMNRSRLRRVAPTVVYVELVDPAGNVVDRDCWGTGC